MESKTTLSSRKLTVVKLLVAIALSFYVAGIVSIALNN